MKYNHIYGNTGLDLLVTGWLNASKCLYELQEIRRDFAPSLVTPLPRTVAGTPRLCRHPKEVFIVFKMEENATFTNLHIKALRSVALIYPGSIKGESDRLKVALV